MSRFYDIQIGGDTAARFTNQVNGVYDPGALMVEFDIPAVPFAAPMGLASVVIWGVSLAQVEQASDFNGAPISVYGGMQKGLPLATADVQQQGLLVQGSIFQAFGNWMGVNQTLNLVIQGGPTTGTGTQDQPANLAFKWKKGTELSDMVTQTLNQAYPGIQVNSNVSSGLILPADETGYYQTLTQFAQYVKNVSQAIKGDNYAGVDIVITENSFNIFDGTSQSSPNQLAFQDLIGQPTWLNSSMVQFNTVMRADLQLGDAIKFPPLAAFQTTTTQQSQSQARSKVAFNGTWNLSMVRHIGNSRASEANQWITTFQAVSNSDAPQSATNPQGNTGA